MEKNQIQLTNQANSLQELSIPKENFSKIACIKKINVIRSFPISDADLVEGFDMIESIVPGVTEEEILKAIQDLATGRRKYFVNEGLRSLIIALDINRNGDTYYESE